MAKKQVTKKRSSTRKATTKKKKTTARGRKLYRVLSLDGGGIRGLIQAIILAQIEKKTGKRIADLFDLIAGTSTGGILAAGLVTPGPAGTPRYSAEALISLYEREGSVIFSRDVWHRVHSLWGMSQEKYPSAPIEDVLERYFGHARLMETLKPVIITSYEIERRMPFFFRSVTARKDPSYDFFLRDVARATSAAPTYFEPHRIEVSGSQDYWALVDGGVFANNPAMCAYVEAKSLAGEDADILMVSIGTGELTRRYPYDEVVSWGLAQWVRPALDVVFDGVADTVDYQAKTLLPTGTDGQSRYYRFQTTLREGNDDMDDAGTTNLRVLTLLAEDLLRRHRQVLNNLCDQLVSS